VSERLLGLYEKLILRHPVVSLLAIILIAITMALGLPNLKLDASLDSLTLENDSDLAAYRESIQRYGSSDFLIVTYRPKEGDLFDDNNLQTLNEICEELRSINGIETVTSILNVPLLYSPKIKIEELKETSRTLLQSDTDRGLARKEFLESPVYRNLVVSEDGQTTIILAEMALDEKYQKLVKQRDTLRIKHDAEGLSAEETLELKTISQDFLDYRTLRAAEEQVRVAEIRKKMSPFKEHSQIFLGGLSMITSDMVAFIKSDLNVFGAGVVLFIIITLAIIFRQFRWVLLPLATCILSVEIMLGYLGWIDWRMTVVSSNFVSLLLITTLALTIHLIVRYRELQRQFPNKEQLELVRDTVKTMARPCIYAVLTTAVAFSSLVVSDIRPVIDFGWMMTIGLVLALILAFVVIPAGMMIWGKGANNDKGDDSSAFTLYFSRFTENHGGLVIGLSLLAAITSAWGIFQLKVDNHFIDYFHADTEIYQGLSTIDNKLGGTIPLDIILDAPPTIDDGSLSTEELLAEEAYGSVDNSSLSPEELAAEEAYAAADKSSLSPEELAAEEAYGSADDSEEFEIIEDSHWLTRAGIGELRKLHEYLDSLPEVGKVSSLVTAADVYSDLVGHPISDFELALMSLLMSPENAKFLLTPYVDERLNQARITLRVRDSLGELNRAELLDKIHRFAIDEAGFKEEQVQFTGLMVLYNNMLQSLFRSQILTLGTVFLCIMAMFLVLFRSLSISVIAILPNLLAAGVVLGGMGIAGIPLDMMTITIAAITVGVGVDHDIHYITRFKHEFAIDHDYIASMHRAHASIGRALFYTAITIIVGFSILTLSNFIPSVYFGLLTGLAMFAALLASMTLLPKLILIFKPFKKEQLIET
jgi:predicted RND superfamily exporter protein